jgi:hypothetical protein
MNLFELRADSNRFQNLVFEKESDVLGITQQFSGDPVRKPWRPPRVLPLQDSASKLLPPSDFPNLYGLIPVFSRRAIDALGPYLERSGELLSLESDEADYYALNVTCVVNVLDETASEVERFPDGRVMLIKRHAFVDDIESRLHGNAVFKIPQRRRSVCYVTDAFVSAAQQHELIGFMFRRV